ncbi:Uma2 family endonuclease [Tsukamurella ocularis]
MSATLGPPVTGESSPSACRSFAVASGHDRPIRSRVAHAGGLTAADVLLAVEILSPGSGRTDRVIKRAEYAVAGIRHYWIGDLDGPSAEVLTLVDGAYEGPTVADRVAVDGRLPLVVDLSALR